MQILNVEHIQYGAKKEFTYKEHGKSGAYQANTPNKHISTLNRKKIRSA
jgi:hypothetical protein